MLGHSNRFEELERDVLKSKFEVGAAFREHCLGYRAGLPSRLATRLMLAEAALNNCEAIANYVRTASSPVADRLTLELVSAAESLEEVRFSEDMAGLRSWYEERLAPLLAESEMAAYLVATTIRLGKDEYGFRWETNIEDLIDAHLARFGKRAADVKYLEELCPTCGNRYDEFGWCGHGNIGGD